MLRRTCLVLAILALMTALLMTKRSGMAAPDMQTITLNTGFNHDTQQVFGIGTPDQFWTVIQDPVTSTNEARAADTIQKHSAWQPPLGTNESQWISYTTNGAQGIVKGPYFYQKCFCLTRALWANREAIAQSSLDFAVRSDDAFYLGLNIAPASLGPSSNHLASGGGAGGFSGPPAVLKITGDKLVSLLRPGRNCLTVRVDDVGTVITGFNLKGGLTTTGVTGIAKAAKPGPQFDRCSACQGTRPDLEADAKSNIEGMIRRAP
jgi:hypothetical protein